MAKTRDKHLRGKSSEEIYRAHQGMSPDGMPLPGVEPHHSCKCDDCKSHRKTINVQEQAEQVDVDPEDEQ